MAKVAVLGKFEKQPAEILDYDVDYTDWFSNRTDTPAAVAPVAVIVEAGITLVTFSLTDLVVKVIISGGTAAAAGITPNKHKVTVRMTTTAGLVKEADFTITIKEV
jgi:hypothetical protein